jgi:uncharacterized phage protein (TIGR01671 family)
MKNRAYESMRENGGVCEMREIKFRVWDENSESMIYDVGITPEGIPYSIPEYAEASDQFHYYPSCHEMQYTGVKDKNRVEIYEGDIVHFIRPDLPYIIRGNGYFDTDVEEGFQLKGEVKFLYGCWFIDEGEGKGCPLEFEKEQILEVIGHVYHK